MIITKMQYVYNVALWLLLMTPIHDAHQQQKQNSNASLKCKDPTGADVDWFITYKLPKIKASANSYVREGLGFAYILPGVQDWKLSNIGVDDSESLVALTLKPLFHEIGSSKLNNDADIAYILYNDQPPDQPTTDSNGHTKGVILTNANQGIWLQHSVPHFPNFNLPKYSYPTTGKNNGQILHCMSLDVAQVDNIGNILEITKPHVYNYSIPDALANSVPTLKKVVVHVHKNGHQNENSSFAAAISTSVNGNDVVNNKIIQIGNAGRVISSFAKGPSFHEEIYKDWIAPNYNSDLDVQSWLNGPNPYSSNCSKLHVYNIEEKEIAGERFSTHSDHSKWAIAIQQPVVCISDLNRMEHQTKRGGSVNCFVEKNIWKAFKKSVVTTQPCPRSLFKGKHNMYNFWYKLQHYMIKKSHLA